MLLKISVGRLNDEFHNLETVVLQKTSNRRQKNMPKTKIIPINCAPLGVSKSKPCLQRTPW